MSMRLLSAIYGSNVDDTRRRHELKQKLIAMVGQQLMFVTVDCQSDPVVMSRKSLTNVDVKQFMKENDDILLQRAAIILAKYQCIYLACDRYDVKNIKTAEHSRREQSGQQYSKLKPDMKIPDLPNLMKNGNNKDVLLELVENEIRQEHASHGNRVVYIARKGSCTRISRRGYNLVLDLETDHIEADAMLSYIIDHSFKFNDQCSVVRSASGDTDIPVLLFAGMERDMKVVLDNGTGKTRKSIALHECPLSDLERNALVGFHAFTGNDYVS